MSNLVFPTLPGMDVEPEVLSTARTSTFKTVSGRRQSVSWGAHTRGYRIRFNVLRGTVAAPDESGAGGQNWGAYNEASVVDYFWTTHGDFDSFYFKAPDIGGVALRHVMFSAETFRLRKIMDGLWSCEFTIEVVP